MVNKKVSCWILFKILSCVITRVTMVAESRFRLHYYYYFYYFWGSTNLLNCAIIFAVRLWEPRRSFFSTALLLGFGRVVLWLILLVDSLEVTDLISDVADNCLDREYAHNTYNCTRHSRYTYTKRWRAISKRVGSRNFSIAENSKVYCTELCYSKGLLTECKVCGGKARIDYVCSAVFVFRCCRLPYLWASELVGFASCLHTLSLFSIRCECFHVIEKNSQRANKYCEFFLIRCNYSQQAANQFLRWLEWGFTHCICLAYR